MLMLSISVDTTSYVTVTCCGLDGALVVVLDAAVGAVVVSSVTLRLFVAVTAAGSGGVGSEGAVAATAGEESDADMSEDVILRSEPGSNAPAIFLACVSTGRDLMFTRQFQGSTMGSHCAMRVL